MKKQDPKKMELLLVPYNQWNNNLGQELEILESGTSEEKIKILGNFESTDDVKIIKKIIGCLDDSDIRVRGEAFSSLILNKNNISKFLIESMNDSSKYVRGFGALVLANRKDTDATPAIINLVNDESSLVRSCALGALGYLRAKNAKEIIHKYILDSNLEVQKSALQALIDIDGEISKNEMFEILKEKDAEIQQLVLKIKKSGPEGI